MISRSVIASAFLMTVAAADGFPAVAQELPSARLAATIDFFGARIGMNRAELLAHTPATTFSDTRCTSSPSDDPKVLFLECGAHKLTVDFTAAGKVWKLRASYDLTATSLTIEDARAALVRRYDKPTAGRISGTFTWLSPGVLAAKADLCVGSIMLLSGAIEQRGIPGTATAPLPPIDPDCLPIRTAILAENAGNRGVIVEVNDPRPRIAELVRSPGEPSPK